LKLYWLELAKELSIYQQLLIEEWLIKHDMRNFCITSHGSQDTIVMGISGKIDELIDQDIAKKKNIPVVRRFSGGGTVVVDHSTLFVSFIMNKALFSFPAYPEKIMQWSEKIYAPVFSHQGFCLKENDYVIDSKKFGGNAQYIKKERWLHHTSFLWDYCSDKMQTLLIPKKMPSYRASRPHSDFLCKMKEILPSEKVFFSALRSSLEKEFEVIDISLNQLHIGSLEAPTTKMQIF
jgi:lipoate-protein ligase A